MSGRRVVVFSSAAELGPALAHLVAFWADKALLDHGRFSLGLSGGSLVSMLSKELPALPDLDCSHWLAGFCDERLVPFDDGESTYGLYKECAEDYARKLKEET
ncbi:6-phosphogluconolactonase-like isoform 2-T2 [Salvelinus alpinus]|uniref:6-phosphogluconolactonase-like n=1 Tax=Salvelinus sp. IW2-2015 TaxID=2691554 RepID=UPI000CDFDF88|nr:6-phosphogluconolactonase-like [Salvelinus alpinus]